MRGKLIKTAPGTGAVLSVAAIASLVFALAFFSPVDAVDSDPAIALLASQAIIDHQSLDLNPYRFRNTSAYRLDVDYRIRRKGGGTYYYSIGVPILSVPAVWVANRFGFHMLDQRAEFATQNLLSALSCTVLFALLFLLCRALVGLVPSLTIASASTFGTSVMSTGASGLWTSDYSLIFIVLALLLLVRRERGEHGRLDLACLAALVIAGFLCRPATGVFGFACVLYFVGEREPRLSRGAAGAATAVLLVVALSWLVPVSWIGEYYYSARLRPVNPLGEGIHDLLLSPSRGLFIFSPFLLLVTAGAIWQLPRLGRNRLFWLSVVWIVLHVVLSAVKKGRWWGGHSFGPRVLVDIIPAFVILTCLVWRELAQEGPRTRRRILTGAYVALAGVAVAIHSGQALFNPSTRLWNTSPNIDEFPGYALSWRYPQFLASPTLLAARWDDHKRRDVADRVGRLEPYEMGRVIPFDSGDAVFVDWYDPEAGWRWSRGSTSSVVLRLGHVEPRQLHLLEIVADPLGTQQIGVSVNGTPLDTFVLGGATSAAGRLIVVPGRLLPSNGPTTITFGMSAPSSTATDDRQMAVALRRLRLSALPLDFGGVRFGDDPFFGEGFSAAENGWRWTDGARARLSYPVSAITPGRDYTLEILAFAYGPQRVELTMNGEIIGRDTFPGVETVSRTFRVPGGVLAADRMNQVELRLPDAASAPNDPRSLGLAVVSIRVAPAPP